MEPVPSSRSGSCAFPSKVASAPRRQGATVASSKPSASSGQEPYSTRQSLSRSFDLHEVSHRSLRATSKKLTSPVQRRSSTPPTSSFMQNRSTCASTRNQTILDDVAWMTARIQNFQTAPFLQSSSMSKLRDPKYCLSHVQSQSSKNEDQQEQDVSRLSSSSIQTSCIPPKQTAITLTDEPLSAFKLSEVTLSEEDLLTDFSSTCASDPISRQTPLLNDRTASNYSKVTSFVDDADKNFSNLVHHDLIGSSKKSTSKIRSDLLHRLEALQHRSAVTAKVTRTKKTDTDQKNESLKDSWHGQDLTCHSDAMISSHSQIAVSQSRGGVLAASSPKQVTSLQTELKNFPGSMCWSPKDIKAEPSAFPPIYSSKRVIRPEYYLPLAKEEEIDQKNVSSYLSSSKNQRNLTPNDNVNRVAFQRSSSLCQREAEGEKLRKCLNSRKKFNPLRKSRKCLQTSVGLTEKPAMAYAAVFAGGYHIHESCSSAATEVLSREESSTQISFSDQKDNSTNCMWGVDVLDMKSFHVEEECQKITASESEINHRNGEDSWISEENVEGFLSSRCFEVKNVDSLNTSHRPFDIINGGSVNKEALFSVDGIMSHISTMDEMELSLSSSSKKRSFSVPSKVNCFAKGNPTKCMTESVQSDLTSDKATQIFRISEGNESISNQTSAHCELTPLAYPLLSEFNCSPPEFPNKLYEVSVSEDGKSLDSDLIVSCKPVHDSIHTRQFLEGTGTEEQSYMEEKHVCCNAVTLNDSYKVSLEAQNSMPEKQQPLQSNKMTRPIQSERDSADNPATLVADELRLSDMTMSSPEMKVHVYQCQPSFNNRDEKASPSHSSAEKVPSYSVFRDFTKITRRLSFSAQRASGPEAISKQKTDNDVNKQPKIARLQTNKIIDNNYILDSSSLSSNIAKGCREWDEVNASTTNFATMQPGIMLQKTSHVNSERKDTLTIPCVSNITCKDSSEIVTGESLDTRLTRSHSGRPFQPNHSCEAIYRLQEGPRIDKIVEGNVTLNHFIVSSESHKHAENPQEQTVAFLQESLNEGMDVRTSVSNDRDKADHVNCCNTDEFGLSGQCVSKTLVEFQDDASVLGDTVKGSAERHTVCSPRLQQGETVSSESEMRTPSMLSVYRNPLWLDESNTDIDNYDTFSDQYCPDFTYCSETNLGFINSKSTRLNLLKTNEKMPWDLYDGIGALLSTVPICSDFINKEGSSDILHKCLDFANVNDLNSSWDVKSRPQKKLIKVCEEVENDVNTICKIQLSEGCQKRTNLVRNTLRKFEAKQDFSDSGQADQKQLLVPLKSGTTGQLLSSSSPVNISNISDDDCSSQSFSCSENCMQLKRMQTTYLESSFNSAKSSENCSCKKVLCQDNNYLMNQIATSLGEANPALVDTDHNQLQDAAVEAVANHNRRPERSSQEPCASIQPSGVKIDGATKNQSLKSPSVLSNDQLEADEEVKRVTFVYSDSKDSSHERFNGSLQKKAFVPLSPVDLPAIKQDVHFKRRKQKHSQEQGQQQAHQINLNRLGEKVEGLQMEVTKYKSENERLQNLMKLMIRKWKLFQQCFWRGKRWKTSCRFMACPNSIRIKRCNSLKDTFASKVESGG